MCTWLYPNWAGIVKLYIVRWVSECPCSKKCTKEGVIVSVSVHFVSPFANGRRSDLRNCRSAEPSCTRLGPSCWEAHKTPVYSVVARPEIGSTGSFKDYCPLPPSTFRRSTRNFLDMTGREPCPALRPSVPVGDPMSRVTGPLRWFWP